MRCIDREHTFEHLSLLLEKMQFQRLYKDFFEGLHILKKN